MERGWLLFMLLFWLVCGAILVDATGIASRGNPREILFEPNTEFETRWRVSSQNRDVRVSIVGPLSEYTVIDRENISSADPDKTFKITFVFPESVEKAGLLKHSVVVEEVVEDGAASIGTAVNVRWPINVRVPYPGKYAEVKLRVDNVNVNQNARVALEVWNRGNERIVQQVPTVTLFGTSEEKLTSIPFEALTINASTRASTSIFFNTTGLRPGDYSAYAYVPWPGENNDTDSFKIGSKKVVLIEYTPNITAGKISKFKLQVLNDWAEPVQNLFATIEINEQKFKTAPTNLNPWGGGMLEGFIDARSIEAGQVEAVIFLHYGDITTSHTILLDVLEPEKSLFPDLQQPGLIGFTAILTLIMIVLIVLTVVMMINLRKMQEKLNEKK